MTEDKKNDIKTPWGGIGYVTFKRTYARRLNNDDPNSNTEEFSQTIDRVLNAAQSQLDVGFTHEELVRARELFLALKGSVAGRFLWQLGTKTVDNLGLLSLQNCAFVTADGPIRPFTWAFDALMLGCFPPETDIVTEHGIKKIKNAKIGEKVWTFNSSKNCLELKPVTATHAVMVNKEDNIKIIGNFGSLTTSKNHPVLVYRDKQWLYVPASLVKLGDSLQKFNIPDTTPAFNKKAWFVGAFLGDGSSNMTSVGSRRVRIAGDNEEIVRDFGNILSSLSGESATYTLSTNPSYSVPVWVMEKTLNRDNFITKNWINLVGDLPTSKTKVISIPTWIKESFDKNTFFSFIAGLVDTDGCVTEGKIQIATSSKQLVEDIKTYGPLYSLYPYVTECTPESYTSSGYKPTSTMYKMNFAANNFINYTPFFLHPKKRQKIEDACNIDRQHYKPLSVPLCLVEDEIQYLGLKENSYHFREKVSRTGSVMTGYYVSREKSYSHLQKFDTVVEIQTELVIDPNFIDLTVEDNHNYICGDGSYYVTHNSGVGFNLQKEYVHEIPKVKYKVAITRKDTSDADFIIPDSRQGWITLLRKTLDAHFNTGNGFTYSTICVRGKGSLIKSFGGVASGPDELCVGIEQISTVLNNRVSKKLRPIDVLDIFNIIGSIVVSGNVRRCLPKNSLVYTNKGLIEISNILVGDRVHTSEGLHTVTNVFEQGNQIVSKIITNSGNFYGTPTHKMAVLSESGTHTWKEIKDLTPSDVLLHFKNEIEGKITHFPPDFTQIRSKMSTTCSNITIPDLTTDTAWYIGLVHGDGYVYNRQNKKYNHFVKGGSSKVCTAHHASDVAAIEKASKILSNFTASDIHVKKKKGENCVQVTVHSQRLAEYFERYVKQPKIELAVPTWILEGTKEVRGAYLAGLMDSDGAHNNRPVHLVTTIYYNFSKQVQNLYASLGIPTRLFVTTPKDEAWQKKYNIVLIGFKEQYNSKVGIYSTKGPVKLTHKQQGFSVPSSVVKTAFKDKDYRGIWNSTKSYGMNYETFSEIGGNLPYIPIKIKEIVHNYKEVETYDLEIDTKHEFFADGLLTHNSAEVALGDMDDLQYLNAKRWDKGIPNWRALSNNSVVCNDINLLPEQFWQGYDGKGEPYGLINLKLARSCGRINDTQYKDLEVAGVNPCSEQFLNNFETCCLSELFLPNLSSLEEAKEMATYLYRINKHSLRLPCHLKETSDIVHKNMRMGIGVTGYLQATEEQKLWLPELYKYIREYDVAYSKSKGWPVSIKLTTVKPSGTLSLLAGVTPGVHPGFSKYFTRRIRMSSNSELYKLCKEAGYKTEFQKNFDGTEDYNTVVVEFPCSYPDGTILAKDVDAVQQLEYVKRLQTDWSDNAVSCTVYYKKEELPRIKEWLLENYNNNIKAVSFLLHKDHGFIQAPYEEITEDQYNKIVKKVKPLTNIMKDDVDLIDNLECEGGACPVK